MMLHTLIDKGKFSKIWQNPFTVRFPTTDDAGGGGDLQLVGFVLEEVLQAGADVGFVDGEDDDFVIGGSSSLTVTEKVMTWSCFP